MCIYDFDYYMIDQPPVPFDPAVHAQCACRSVKPGETITIWVEEGTYEYVACPSAPRDPWGEIHDDHDCPYCIDGEWERTKVNPITETRCARCDAAAKLLHEWCDGMYSVQGIPEQICEHWSEDELYRSMPFARLVLLAGRGWRSRTGRLADVATLQDLVARSIAKMAVPL